MLHDYCQLYVKKKNIIEYIEYIVLSVVNYHVNYNIIPQSKDHRLQIPCSLLISFDDEETYKIIDKLNATLRQSDIKQTFFNL